jgi:integrase
VSTLADTWLAADHGWSTGTERTYRSTVRAQVIPAFGRLCLREITPGTVSRALATIAKTSGPGAAKTARACLSGMFALAIADGAVLANPVRDASARLNTRAKKAPRALTVEDTARLVELFRGSARASELDVADLVDWMLATGARIGEAVALSAGQAGGRPLLDLDAGTWEVNGTVVRVPKKPADRGRTNPRPGPGRPAPARWLSWLTGPASPRRSARTCASLRTLQPLCREPRMRPVQPTDAA